MANEQPSDNFEWNVVASEMPPNDAKIFDELFIKEFVTNNSCTCDKDEAYICDCDIGVKLQINGNTDSVRDFIISLTNAEIASFQSPIFILNEYCNDRDSLNAHNNFLANYLKIRCHYNEFGFYKREWKLIYMNALYMLQDTNNPTIIEAIVNRVNTLNKRRASVKSAVVLVGRSAKGKELMQKFFPEYYYNFLMQHDNMTLDELKQCISAGVNINPNHFDKNVAVACELVKESFMSKDENLIKQAKNIFNNLFKENPYECVKIMFQGSN